MKTRIIWLTLLFSLIWMGPLGAEESTEMRTISVNGEAEIRVVPDEVILTLGVETWHEDMVEAKAKNDSIISKTIRVAKAHDIPEKHIQTDYIDIEARYEDGYQKRDFIGYFVRKTVVVTLRDLDEFESLLSGVLAVGTTNVHGIQFRTTELRKHRDEARAKAIRAAKEKAVALAAELDQTVGQPITINEGGNWWSGGSRWWGGSRYNMMSQNVIQNASVRGDSNGSLAPGQISVTANVSVTFELE